MQRSEFQNSRNRLWEMLHRQRNLQHPGQPGVSPGGRSRTAGHGARLWGGSSGSLAHVGVCTCGLLPAHPGSTGSASKRRLPGKCPQGRDGQDCAPCPTRKALPSAASPAQPQLLLCPCLGPSPCAAAAALREFTGLRELPGQLQGAAHPCGVGREQGRAQLQCQPKWTEDSASPAAPCPVLGHHLLSSPRGPSSEISQLQGAGCGLQKSVCSWERSGTGDPLMGAGIS